MRRFEEPYRLFAGLPAGSVLAGYPDSDLLVTAPVFSGKGLLLSSETADQELLYRASLLAAPAVWIEFMADFEGGGVGSQRAPRDFALDMRRARRHRGALLGGSRVADEAATAAAVAFRGGLAAQSRLRRRLRER